MMTMTSYDILRRPVITEKSTMQSAENKISFRVDMGATKPAIKKAVESLYNVKVSAVNIIRQEGKQKRFRGQLGRRNAFKKAIVTLADGQSIDVMSGVK